MEGPDAPLWLDVLAHISLGITTLFLVEVPVTLWALGPAYYNPFGSFPHASLHLFDALVILGTFVLEIVLKGRERELAGLLIILRLWRLVKLVGGEHSAAHHQYDIIRIVPDNESIMQELLWAPERSRKRMRKPWQKLLKSVIAL